MDKNIHNNSQVLQQIEWNQLISKLNSNTHFHHTSANILQYLSSQEDINKKLSYTKYFEEIHYDNEFKHLISAIRNIKPDQDFFSQLSLLKRSGTLTLSELNQLIICAEFFIDNYKSLNKYHFTRMSLDNFHQFKQKLNQKILKEFRSFITPDGDIDYSKHPLLKHLFFEQQQIESSIRAKINDSLKSSELKDRIQFSSFDIINDRFVIPIRSDSFQHSFGQIIARSDTGNTLYVEPKSISSQNYKRIEIIVEIQNIISTLEIKLSRILSDFSNELHMIFSHIYHIDEFNSRLGFALDLNLTEPILISDKKIHLIDSFHPLIVNPIKNTIEISHEHKGMIISGPNTGGKTATLKTIALIQMLIRYGLFIPCTYGEIFLYDKVFYFGNDQQDLNQGLSSFSAEVQNYSNLVDELGCSNLILIDEIFNSTSSEEASALAVSLFNSLSSLSDNHIIVSSHHQTLKTFLHQDSSYLSAHVGYDIKNNKPTYKLYFGAPGSSQALNIFKSLTNNNELFAKIYSNSLHFLDNKIIHYEKLLESLSHKENELNKSLSTNKEITHNLANQKKAMDGVIKLKIDEKVKHTQHKLDKLLKKAENLLIDVRAGEITKNKSLSIQTHKIKSELNSIIPEKETVQKDYSNLHIPDKIEANKKYFCLKLNKTVLVKKIMKKDVSVQAGHFILKVPIDSLRIANRAPKKVVSIESHTSVSRSRDTQLEYDCRGMRLDEFQSLVEVATSDLLLGNCPYINIIHGHGTGVLKNWLRKHIRTHKDITIDSNNNGNDGETRIKLV